MIWIMKPRNTTMEYVGFINFKTGELLTINDKKDYVQIYKKPIEEWIKATYPDAE